MYGLGYGWRLMRLSCVCIGVGILLVTATMALGSFSASDRYTAAVNSLGRRYVYLVDAEKTLAIRRNPPLDPKAIVALSIYWQDPRQIFITQREFGESILDNRNVLMRMDVESGELVRLVEGSPRGESITDSVLQGIPIIAPNQRYVALIDYVQGDIYVLDTEIEKTAQVFDTSEHISAGNPNYQIYYAPVWSPDSRYLAYPHGSTIYVLLLDTSEPLKFQNADGAVVGYPQWSKDGSTIYTSIEMSTQGGQSQRMNISTGEVETFTQDAYRSFWHCDGGWLTYTTWREREESSGQSESSSSLAGHVIDADTGETFHLDEITDLRAVDVERITIPDCRAPHMLVLFGRSQTQQQVEQPRTLYPIYLFNSETGEVEKIADSATAAGWDEGLDMLVYSVLDKNNVYTLYRRPLAMDAAPTIMGSHALIGISGLYSRDYSHVLTLEGNSVRSSEGRLVRIDLQSGVKTYLTPPGVLVSFPYKWD